MLLRNDLLNTPPAPSLDHLLSLCDERFLYCAYKTFLGRFPDEDGLKTYLPRLRAGINKRDIIFDLAVSSEGQEKALKLEGWLAPTGNLLTRRILRRLAPLWLVVNPFARLRLFLRQMENRQGMCFEQIVCATEARPDRDAFSGKANVTPGIVLPSGKSDAMTPYAKAIYFRLKAAEAAGYRRAF